MEGARQEMSDGVEKGKESDGESERRHDSSGHNGISLPRLSCTSHRTLLAYQHTEVMAGEANDM